MKKQSIKALALMALLAISCVSVCDDKNCPTPTFKVQVIKEKPEKLKKSEPSILKSIGHDVARQLSMVALGLTGSYVAGHAGQFAAELGGVVGQSAAEYYFEGQEASARVVAEYGGTKVANKLHQYNESFLGLDSFEKHMAGEYLGDLAVDVLYKNKEAAVKDTFGFVGGLGGYRLSRQRWPVLDKSVTRKINFFVSDLCKSRIRKLKGAHNCCNQGIKALVSI